jgi:hypothetical protein
MKISSMRRQFLLIFLLILLANAIFLVFTLAGYLTPAPVSERIITAFAQGELVNQDYLRFDSRRGFHQYNDCMILQMLYNRNPRIPALALAPTGYFSSDREIGQCQLLYALVTGSTQPETLSQGQYARYWHGYNVLILFGLKFIEIGVLRKLLVIGAWLAIGMLAIISLKAGMACAAHRVVHRSIRADLLGTTLFCPELYPRTWRHPRADRRRRLNVLGEENTHAQFLLPYAAVFGSAVVFLEMLTGQLPVAAAWMAVMVLAVIRDKGLFTGKNGYLTVLYALIAFGAGAVLTILIKQLLAYAVIDSGALNVFSGKLDLYMRIPEPVDGIPGFLLAFGRMAKRFSVLVYGRTNVSYLMLVLIGLAWIMNLMLAFRNRYNPFGTDVTALLLIASIPLLWILLLQTHTYIHADFMVRILVVPLSVAPLPLLWKKSNQQADQ